MKKILAIVFLIIILSNNVYAISNEFEKTINIIGINRYNNQGYEINEQIYNKYSQIVYGSPELAIKELTQRWKNVENGKWIKDNQKGEYRILGYNYSGKVINNHEFPEDVVPKSSPENWTYVELKDAISSWNNANLYKFVEQKQYMQNTNLIRNNIEYNLTCNKIGLNKTRIESYSTLNNRGTIYTNRLDPYGKKWEATFLTNPMNKNMEYIVNINTPKDTYTIKFDEEYIDIPVTIKTQLKSDTELVTDKFIKSIYNEIYIDKEFEKETITNSKLENTEVVNIRIDKNKYNNIKGIYNLNIELISKTYTQFKEDHPFNGQDSKDITIIIEEENQEEEGKTNEDKFVNNSSVVLRKKQIDNNEIQYKELYRTISTNDNNSQGFICAGNILGIRFNTTKNTYKVEMTILGDESIRNFDDLTKKFEWEEPKKRGNSTIYTKLEDFNNLYNKSKYELIPQYNTTNKNNVYLFEYLIPYGTNQTLHSWNSIREQTGNSLNINENILFKRIKEPYILSFKIYNLISKKNKDGTTTTYTQIKTETVKFDVFERWNNLYNRDLSKYILNKNPNILNSVNWKKL